MRKVYIPLYLIEWSDVRPYAVKVAHGLKVAALYVGKALKQLALWIAIAAPYVWRALKWFFIQIFQLLLKMGRGLWNMFKGIFTVANPRNEEDEEDDNADNEPSYDDEDEPSRASTPRAPRNLFDGED